MDEKIDIKKSGKEKSFSFNGIIMRIVSVFSKKKGEPEELKLEDNEKENGVVVELQSEETEEKSEESFIDKAKSAVEGTLSDLNNTFATVSDDDTKKEENIDYKKEFDNVKHLKNGNIAVLKKDCFVALGASYRDFRGVYNKKGEQIIPVCYVEIKELENGCYACKSLEGHGRYYDMKWTLYDEDGEIIVSGVDGYILKDGNLFVKSSPYSSTYWMINKQGKCIFPKEYFGNLDSEEKIENKKDGFRPSGFEYRPNGFAYSSIFSPDKKGKPELGLKILMYKDGKVDETSHEHYGIGGFKDGGMLVKVYNSKYEGCFDENFNLVVPFDYDEVGKFKDGVVLLCKYNKGNGKKEYSFKKKNGESLGKKKEIGRGGMFETDMTYDDAHEFKDGAAAVCNDGLWGFIDNNGNAITNLEFSEVTDFSNGKAEVVKRVGGKDIRFWINKKGEYLLGKNDTAEDFEKYEKKFGKDTINLLRLGKKYQKIEKISEGVYAVRGYKGKAYRFIDLEGNQIDGTDFYSFKKLKNGMILIETKNDRFCPDWHILDKNLNKITDKYFGEVREFEDGIAAVCMKVSINGGYAYRWKFINEKGEFINDKTYFKVGDFENGKAKVREEKDSEKYYIDTNGNRID